MPIELPEIKRPNPTRIWGTAGVTVNLGSYESRRFEVGEEWPVGDQDVTLLKIEFGKALEERLDNAVRGALTGLKLPAATWHGQNRPGAVAVHFGLRE